MTDLDWPTARATGIAERLASLGVCAWNPDGLYTAGQIGAFTGLLPDQPPAALGIICTPLAPANGVTQLRVQVLCRAGTPDPRQTTRLAQQVVDALDHVTDLDLAGEPVPLLTLQSWADPFPDSSGRPVSSLNFYAFASFATPAFRD